MQNEKAIVDELTRFLAIPNVASDLPNIEKNAQAIIEMFKARGVEARTLRMEGVPPLVVADLRVPGAKQTVAFYAHYDGQPVDPAQWSTPPWEPAIKPAGPITPESRIYARSASDDKSPIVALAAALDALRANRIKPKVNIKFVFEGEEEAGSPNLAEYMQKFADDLAVDAWIMCDGPVHQSRKMQVYFGARGVVDLELTVYGPRRALHSGHYGNWAPNPALALARLLASMKDERGDVLIEGFYDGTAPIGEEERAAIAEASSFDDPLRAQLGLAATEADDAPYLERMLIPSLNIRGLSSATTGAAARNIVPPTATASLDIRLAKGNDPERMLDLVEAHVREQGYHVVRADPDSATRVAHERIARIDRFPGYPAARVSLDTPIARDVIGAATRAAGEPPILAPTLGGSLPLYLFEEVLATPAVGVPIANHDDNQHAPDENLRLANLWYGIDLVAALMTM